MSELTNATDQKAFYSVDSIFLYFYYTRSL